MHLLKASRLMIAALVVALVTGIGFMSPASADPVRGAGCNSWSGKQKYTVAGITYYGIEMNLNFCWTTGGADSRIKNLTGSAYSWANGTNQVQNTVGPANVDKIPISSSWVSTGNASNIYFFFQSRACLTGPLDFGCSSWAWHRIKIRLNYGGEVEMVEHD